MNFIYYHRLGDSKTPITFTISFINLTLKYMREHNQYSSFVELMYEICGEQEILYICKYINTRIFFVLPIAYKDIDYIQFIKTVCGSEISIVYMTCVHRSDFLFNDNQSKFYEFSNAATSDRCGVGKHQRSSFSFRKTEEKTTLSVRVRKIRKQ